MLMQTYFEIEAIQQRANMNSKKVKWTDFYKTETELLNVLKNANNDKIKSLVDKRYIKGYEYILSFKKQLDQQKELSDKQITQLKRLAIEVYKIEKLSELL